MTQDSDQAAAFYSDTNVGPDAYDMFAGHSSLWLQTGASLLRASGVLNQHRHIEHARIVEEIRLRNERGVVRADVFRPALMLAALAVENALKAVIVEREPGLIAGGKLPAELKNHDIFRLATRAEVAAADDDEKCALKYGKHFIETEGKYPLPTKSAEWKTRISIDGRVWFALCRLYFRAVEAEARVAHARWDNLRTKPIDSVVSERVSAMKALVGFSDDGREFP